MKTPEDEAFDELARKQGAWGGGFTAKRKMAADKLWDKPSVAFDEWWNSDNDESTNPFRLESGAYWAWAGWKAALAQPVQEPPSEWTGIKAILDEYGLQAIDFVADFKEALAQPAQEPVSEALKLALEALEESQTDNDTMEFWDRKSKAITAIRQALAQPPLPVQRQPLTGEQAKMIFRMARELEDTGRLTSLSEGAEREAFVQKNRKIQCALEDYLRNLTETTPPLPVQQEAIYGMNQDDWKDVVAAIARVRDGRGIYLGCRPADVFQEWFLALGTAKVKEKNG